MKRSEGTRNHVIVAASTAEHYAQASDLFMAYGSIPGIEACLVSLEEEAASLPGAYAPPPGFLLLALKGDRAVGCVGVLRLEGGVCEMRRLFVRAEARGTKAGRDLAQAALDRAVKIGYRKMRLETLPDRMPAAVALYRSLGFGPIEPYGASPVTGALHMERELP